MGKLSWKVPSRRWGLALAGLLLVVAAADILGGGFSQVTQSATQPKHEPVVWVVADPDGTFTLETAQGFLTFRVDDGIVNVCEPGAQCVRVELEYPVYRLGSIWSRGEVLVLEYFPLGVPGGLRTTFRGMYDIRGRLNQIETGPQPE